MGPLLQFLVCFIQSSPTGIAEPLQFPLHIASNKRPQFKVLASRHFHHTNISIQQIQRSSIELVRQWAEGCNKIDPQPLSRA
jgi:hypothetical protein